MTDGDEEWDRRERVAYLVDCPYYSCKARPGEPCTTDNGIVRSLVHFARVRAILWGDPATRPFIIAEVPW